MKIRKIYVELIEGTKTSVPLEAELTSDGYYKILKNPYLNLEEDATSIWKFFPGDVVKCETQDIDLVATELISSSFPNRKLQELVYLIVDNLGKINPDKLSRFKEEIRILCKDTDIHERKHPLVSAWVSEYC